MARQPMGKYHLKYFQSLTDQELLARTVWAEARNQGLGGMVAVSMVIINRAADRRHRFGKSIKGVILKRWAFSCFEPADPNFNKLMAEGNVSVEMLHARTISEMALSGYLVDVTNKSTHYHHKNAKPYWISKLELKTAIVDHIFYREA